jgi:hypothetical protein
MYCSSAKALSSTLIALKDRRFTSSSSTVSDWKVSVKVFGFGVREFHQACDGMEKCVVVVRAENGRIAAAYNEDGFSSDSIVSANINGFIVSIKGDGSCGARFDRILGQRNGIWSPSLYGPCFYVYLQIVNKCNECESMGVSPNELFGQGYFRVRDYEVFKIE